jgi:hypothetical protein
VHKDFTAQELIVEKLLTEFGLRYEMQWKVPGTNYLADFYIEEIKMV